MDNGVIIHKNEWCWGRKQTIVLNGGYALCTVSVEDDDYSVAYLADVIVHKDKRGKGLGNKLLDIALRRAQLMQADKVCLWANKSDWPFEWYKRRGFEPVCEKDGMVLMEKSLWD